MQAPTAEKGERKEEKLTPPVKGTNAALCGSGSWVVTGIREIDGSSGTTSVVACCSALIVYVSWACVWTGVAANGRSVNTTKNK
ncbi:hypothetical protein [Enterococcus lactis]|uniref:hypothetical protein n=1 Tax=Enterococcus lactis TaxID=357441 RepID=UPI001F2208BF|nr:hypothetical protein [Enterococcus lactis]